MIKKFNNFSESIEDEDKKFIAVAKQFYMDFTDIMLGNSKVIYNIKLIKIPILKSNKDIKFETVYKINIIVNSFDLLNSDMPVLNEVRDLQSEFIKYYNDGVSNPMALVLNDKIDTKLGFKISTTQYSFSTNEKVLYSEGDESFDNAKRVRYLERVKLALNKFKESYNELGSLWYQDDEYGVDLGLFLDEDFPFNESFDEIGVDQWVDGSIDRIDDTI